MDNIEKAKALLKKMTLEEKIAQLHSIWVNIHEDGTLSLRSASENVENSLDPLEVIKDGVGQITRPLGTHPIDPRAGVRGVNIVQEFLTKKTRLGIPALTHEECLAGVMAQGATLFPAGINNGATWDDELITRIASAVREELYSIGGRQGLAPVLDVARDSRWGRTEETMGEDPYLTGRLGTAYVKGLQGENRKILATLKHFAGHSFPEGGRNHAPVRIGERELNDTFLLPFEMAIKEGKAGSIMPAYHDIDGIPMHQSKYYLNELLRDKWNFDGIIVADYEGITHLYSDHHTAKDITEAALFSFQAGIDIEFPEYKCFKEGLKNAIKYGRLEMKEINTAVLRILKLKYQLGLFDNPYIDEGQIFPDKDKHRQLAEEAAINSTVLLENNGILPMKANKKLALIGPLADDKLGFYSGYSFPVHLILSGQEADRQKLPTLKQKLHERLGNQLLYAQGCKILTERPKEAPVYPGDIGSSDSAIQKDYISKDTSGFDEAVKTAEKADVVIMALGDLSGLFLTGTVGEGSDTSTLTLPGVQQQLLEKILEIGKPVIVILFSGRPYHLGKGFSQTDAILQAWLPGETGANAINKILFGEAEPGGRLPVSIPKSAGAMPYFYNYKFKSAGTPIQPDFGAEYPFGFGLSYTSIQYDDFSLENDTIPIDGVIKISFTLSNKGPREGWEVPQLYIRDCYASLVRPLKELKGFKKVLLSPGESKRIIFTLPTDLLAFTIEKTIRQIEPGEFDIMIGQSSRDIIFTKTITLTGENRILPENWRMKTIAEEMLL